MTHEETWIASSHRVDTPNGKIEPTVNPPNREPAICALVAAAPDMARVLLKVEWAGRQDYVGDGGYDCCSCCGGIAPDNERMSDAVDDLATGKTVVGHYAECELVVALQKAGVR